MSLFKIIILEFFVKIWFFVEILLIKIAVIAIALVTL